MILSRRLFLATPALLAVGQAALAQSDPHDAARVTADDWKTRVLLDTQVTAQREAYLFRIFTIYPGSTQIHMGTCVISFAELDRAKLIQNHDLARAKAENAVNSTRFDLLDKGAPDMPPVRRDILMLQLQTAFMKAFSGSANLGLS